MFVEDNGSNHVEPDNITTTLKLSHNVSESQFGQFYTDTDVSWRSYILDFGLSLLIDRIGETLKTDDTALQISSAFVAGHCMGLKKINDGYKFFDCNIGEFEFKNIDTFKTWFPEYLKNVYLGFFHIHTYEIFTNQVHEVSAFTRAVNLIKNFAKALIKIAILPLGMGVAFIATGRAIHLLANYLFKAKSSQE